MNNFVGAPGARPTFWDGPDGSSLVSPELRFARSGGSGLLTTSRLQTTLSFIDRPAGPGLTLGTTRSRGRPILHEDSSILASPGQATSGGPFHRRSPQTSTPSRGQQPLPGCAANPMNQSANSEDRPLHEVIGRRGRRSQNFRRSRGTTARPLVWSAHGAQYTGRKPTVRRARNPASTRQSR